LHPNAQGYTLMTPVASAAIAEALKREAIPPGSGNVVVG
jgi:hypothetical protein